MPADGCIGDWVRFSYTFTIILYSLQAQCEPLWDEQRKGLNKAVAMLEECVRIDAHDYLALYYCALLHAIGMFRNFEI